MCPWIEFRGLRKLVVVEVGRKSWEGLGENLVALGLALRFQVVDKHYNITHEMQTCRVHYNHVRGAIAAN